MYVRIAKTLDLGPYVWYGAIVLAIEIAGATTTLVWCLNIVLDPIHEPLRMDPDNPGLTLVRLSWRCCKSRWLQCKAVCAKLCLLTAPVFL